MPNNNNTLNKAQTRKKDEFYTQYEDVEKELSLHDFSGSTVYCPCDDYDKSAFVKYFREHFNLKMLITSAISGKFMIKTQEKEEFFEGDGNFLFCKKYFDMADYVVTNPPFSMFHEFFECIKNKKFLVLGPQNAVTYNEVFPYFKSGEVFFTTTIRNGDIMFTVPDDYELEAAGCGVNEKGQKYIRVPSIRWFTNFDKVERPFIELTQKYTPEKYPEYSNCEAINVGKTKDIPCDYKGVMGVPVTFLDKYNPRQFELVGMMNSPVLNGKTVYKRLLVRNRIF